MEDNNSEINRQHVDECADASGDIESGASDPKGKVTKKALTGRAMLLIGIGGLLVVLLIAGAVAWYTRISQVNQISMDAAQFDFKANYSAGSYIVQADDYITLYGEHKVAPGTAGVIPIKVETGDSQVDISYSLSIDTDGMDPAFRRRIRFFYIPNGATYSYGIEKTLSKNESIKGKLTVADTSPHYEYIYWEWIYDLNDKVFYSTPSGTWKNSPSAAQTQEFRSFIAGDATPSEVADAKIAAAKDAFDEMDTNISLGKYDSEFVSPDEPFKDYASSSQTLFWVNERGEYEATQSQILKAYQKAMSGKIDIVGAIATPKYDRNPTPGDRASTYGSKYVDLETVINAHNAVYQP